MPNVLTTDTSTASNDYAERDTLYDGAGRVSCTIDRMVPSSTGPLPTSCAPVQTTSAMGPDRVTKFNYDVTNRIATKQSGVGTASAITETTAYTPNGKTAYVVDANSNRTTYEYDGHDRLVTTSFPQATLGSNASSATDYQQQTYGDNVNITSIRLRDGNTIGLTYDNLGRVTSRTPSGENAVTFSYNLLNMPTAIQRPADGVAVTNTYDALGRRTYEGQPYGSASYQYDVTGNLSRLTWQDGFYVNYDYDAAGRVTTIRENGAASGIGVLATYSYDSLGRRSGVTYGNGTSRASAYDAVGRLAGLKIDLAGSTNDEVIGGVGGVGTAIGYNPVSQIVSLTRSNDAYAYSGRYNVSRSYTVNGLNQYTASGAISLGYDGRGNLNSSGTSVYNYSKLNELISAPGATLSYDPLGRLLQYTASGATRFGYAGSSLISETDASSIMLRRYVPGPGTDEPVMWYEGAGTADRRWLQADERGSVVAISDSSGNAMAINRYDEYGIPEPGNLGRFQYTGQTWFAEAGLYNYKARMYSPSLGRFMQTDPVGYLDGLNWHNYVGSDPINRTDPTGLACYGNRAYCYGDELIDGSGLDVIVVVGRPKQSSNNQSGSTNAQRTNQNIRSGSNPGVTVRPPRASEAGTQQAQSNQPCGESSDSTLDTVRNGLEWLSVGADGLSIAATATGVGAPIGGLIKGVQIGLEVGLAGINLYDASQNGNFAPALSQVAGRLAVGLVPGGRIGNRLRSSAALNWGAQANGRLRSGFQHKIAAQNQAIDTVTGQATGGVSQAAMCVGR